MVILERPCLGILRSLLRGFPAPTYCSGQGVPDSRQSQFQKHQLGLQNSVILSLICSTVCFVLASAYRIEFTCWRLCYCMKNWNVFSVRTISFTLTAVSTTLIWYHIFHDVITAGNEDLDVICDKKEMCNSISKLSDLLQITQLTCVFRTYFHTKLIILAYTVLPGKWGAIFTQDAKENQGRHA